MNLNLILHDKGITTTNGESFPGTESAILAFLIYKRFGRDLFLACSKWRKMLGNDTPSEEFEKLVRAGEFILSNAQKAVIQI
jgi:hypothetical protein